MEWKNETENIDRALWNNFLASQENGNYRQTVQWGTLRKQAGWIPIFVYAHENGTIHAALLIFARKIPFTGMTLFYGCRGPVLDWSNKSALAALMLGVKAAARTYNAILLRVDPEPGSNTTIICNAMKQAGFFLFEREFTSWNRTQHELRVMLNKPEEELFRGIRRTLRQEINSAKKNGVTISTDPHPDDENRFCEIMAGLETVKNSVLHSASYYQAALRETRSSGGMLVKACFDNKIIAVMTLAFVGDRCWAVYMANDYTYRKLVPNKLLMWEGIRIANSRGCRFFDMGATQAKAFNPDDPLNRYKLGFMPQVVHFPGYFDYSFMPVLYHLFKFLEFKVVPIVHYIKRRFTMIGKKRADRKVVRENQITEKINNE
jgi:lipid II:glycine glycyltransferase (peptidoglycan interpeptide bridge formation enzyme)